MSVNCGRQWGWDVLGMLLDVCLCAGTLPQETQWS